MWLGGYVWESVAVEWIGSGEKNLGGGPGGLRAWGGDWPAGDPGRDHSPGTPPAMSSIAGFSLAPSLSLSLRMRMIPHSLWSHG